MRLALYYPDQRKLRFYVTDQATQVLYNITQDQAIQEIYWVATGPKEIVQRLEIVPNKKI